MAFRSVVAIAATGLLGLLLSTCGDTEGRTSPEEPAGTTSASAAAADSEGLIANSAPSIVASASEPASSAVPAASEQSPSAPSPCPNEMVLIEGEHCFNMTQVCERWDDPEGQPRYRVCGKYKEPSVCTSRRQHLRFCMDREEYRKQDEAVPMTAVSWESASKLCGAQGKRLCRNTEWEFACEGEQGLPYPYGYERSSSLCNTDHLLREGKTHAKADLREPPHASCVSPFGVRDMVGNVDEWVSRPFHKAPNRSELRGGWWMTGRNRCRANTTAHGETYSDRQAGFRCCKQLDNDAPDPQEAMVQPPASGPDETPPRIP